MYLVYSTLHNANDSGEKSFELVCETKRQDVAQFAVKIGAESIGAGLEIIMISDGKIERIVKGKA